VLFQQAQAQATQHGKVLGAMSLGDTIGVFAETNIQMPVLNVRLPRHVAPFDRYRVVTPLDGSTVTAAPWTRQRAITAFVR